VLHDRWSSCAEEPSVRFDEESGREPLTLRLLDATFEPVEVVLCQEVPATAGDVELVVLEKRARDITSLTSALRAPDEPPADPDQGNDELLAQCDLARVEVPWLAVIRADGRWVRPGLPRDSCGAISAAVVDRIRGIVPNSTVTVRPSASR
jgi:hypothetical protein